MANNEDTPIHARWSFEKGPADLDVLRGTPWKWESTSANSGHMVVPLADAAQVSTLVGLPVKFPAHPVSVQIKASIIGIGTVLQGVSWMNGTLLVPCRSWKKRLAMVFRMSPGRLDIRIYFIDRYAVIQWNNQTVFVGEARTPYPSRNIAVSFQGMNVEEIEAHSLLANEVPEFLHNMPQIIKELDVEPEDRDDHGNVVTPAEKK